MKHSRPQVLVLNNDVRQLRMIKRILELEQLRVTTTSDGAATLTLFKQIQPQLVLLDHTLPGMDGRQICRRLREFSDVPIIMVTEESGDREVVEGFDAGADDYITKPFSAGELAARVRAVLRRAAGNHPPVSAVFSLDDLTIDYTTRRVTVRGREVRLTATEYRLLTYFSRNAGRIITPDQLIDHVWGEEYLGTPHLLQVNIARLRKKMGDDARNPTYILTRPGIGYLMAHDGKAVV